MEKKLSKKTLTKSFHNWYYGNLTDYKKSFLTGVITDPWWTESHK